MKRLQLAGHAVNVGEAVQVDQRRARAGFDQRNLAPSDVDLSFTCGHARVLILSCWELFLGAERAALLV
jgi:hypothetical protein